MTSSHYLAAFTLASAAVLYFPADAGAITLSTFDPQSFFTPTGAPTPSEIAALDATAGVTDFLIEDFEDTSLIPGLTVNGDITLISQGSTQFVGAWDGTRAFNRQIADGSDLVFSYAPGATSIAFGISGLDVDEKLFVNGMDFGQISNLAGYRASEPNVNSRNIYIRADIEAGELPITEFRITGPTALPSDFIQIDHLAVTSTVREVPEPSGLLPLTLTSIGLLISRARRMGRSDRS